MRRDRAAVEPDRKRPYFALAGISYSQVKSNNGETRSYFALCTRRLLGFCRSTEGAC